MSMPGEEWRDVVFFVGIVLIIMGSLLLVCSVFLFTGGTK